MTRRAMTAEEADDIISENGTAAVARRFTAAGALTEDEERAWDVLLKRVNEEDGQ